MSRNRRKPAARSDMNVVPYIDVMLVLLVIFMISAPLLNNAVEVDLPKSETAKELLPPDEDAPRPLIISISNSGAFYIDRADDDSLPVSESLIQQITQQTLLEQPNTPVYIRADRHVQYGAVMQMMDVLKNSGAESVGMVTKSAEQ